MSRILAIDASTDITKVGNLGVYLARLKRAGFRVVDGFIIPVEEELQFGLSNEILREFDKHGFTEVALRAAPVEIDIFSSETIRGVKRDVLVETIDYLRKNSLRRGHQVAVVVQKDLNAEFSGTIHSYNPVTLDNNEILIEANLWMNSTVLTGESDTDMILINKNTGALNLESDEENEICLTPQQIAQLYNLIRKIEKKLNEAVSVDWAYNNGVLYILRARPITQKTYERYM
ncbi:MAG: PEP/pyruvate-binding domain-containing protein [Candidatus Saccharibacteria bacterium]|nr:PEP/pyruvate-binding domain-containing protein [Candidatus Saccharibacteria bacterium]